jgi:hypothetical protein
MHLKATLRSRFFSFVPLLLLLAAPCLAAGSIEGHWILVEQNYGSGKANFAPQDEPVHFEFAMEGGELSGKVWEGENRSTAASWPAFDAGDGLLPLQIEERRIDRQSGIIRAEYVVQPDPPDGVVLRIVEDYHVADKGESLVGTTTIYFKRDGEPRGSYVLHRRFERRP